MMFDRGGDAIWILLALEEEKLPRRRECCGL